MPRLALTPKRLLFLIAIASAAGSAQTPHTRFDSVKPDPSQPVQMQSAAQPSTSAAARKLSAEFDVAGTQHWVDTQIDLLVGDRVTFASTGTMQCQGANASGPDGLSRGWADLLRILPVNGAGRGALVGRIGAAEAAVPFLVGAQRELQVTQAGRLFLGVNQPANEEATGSFRVAVKITSAPATAAAAAAKTAAADSALLAKISSDVLGKLPRRVSDPDGNPGDMVNFLILGSEDSVRTAFQSAGWVKVDRTVKDAVLHGLISSISKQSYVEMPMSTLTLFGRPQDYGFAHAEPLSVVATRHHLRIWKAPFEVSGQTLWVGAGTHDIGFDRDQRNNGVTHKIDPEIDVERDYIYASLNSTGMVSTGGYVTPADPVKEARTATGGSFRSDGRVLVMSLASSGTDESAAFADVFCSVLQEENPDQGEWGDCAQYIEAKPSGKTFNLGPLSTKYRVLVLPGFLSSCVASTPALQKGQAHLHDVHGLTVEYLQLPNESSETNGKLIADYLAAHIKSDPRKYIVLGYSKGAPDVQVGLAQSPEAASAVAAFISLAGAVGGSPVANAMPAMIERYTKSLNLGTCQGDIAHAAQSLRSDVRHAFLTSHPFPVVPTYSLAALSDRTNTSKMLLEAWQLLSAYDSAQDSQLTRQDATVPGSTYLGSAHADHLAVALAFEDSSAGAFMDHNHYPRTALFEALVRWVVSDLEKVPTASK